jgi:hypothetical protein
VRVKRAETLNAAYRAFPARFRHRHPGTAEAAQVRWIDEATLEALIQAA